MAALLPTACAPSPEARFAKGLAAHSAGNYPLALSEWQPLADTGHRDAQHNLGIMYFQGQGVETDHAEAAKWFRAAAEQGARRAPLSLALLYASGDGVERDLVQAYKWARIAVDQGDANAENTRGSLGRQMTAEQVAEGESLADAWRPSRSGS